MDTYDLCGYDAVIFGPNGEYLSWEESKFVWIDYIFILARIGR